MNETLWVLRFRIWGSGNSTHIWGFHVRRSYGPWSKLLKGGYYRDYIGELLWGLISKGDTRSSDYSSYGNPEVRQS